MRKLKNHRVSQAAFLRKRRREYSRNTALDKDKANALPSGFVLYMFRATVVGFVSIDDTICLQVQKCEE
jgi:hypothetical protein